MRKSFSDPEKLNYYSYISSAKVNLFYEQLTKLSVDKRTVKHSKEAGASAEVEGGTFFGFLKAGLKGEGRYSQEIEEEGTETTVQKLRKVIDHITKYEDVLDIADIIKKKENVALNAFCYTYEGEFFVLGTIGREQHSSVTINGPSLDKLGDEVIISKKHLIDPSREENSVKEKGPRGSLVSEICIIVSEIKEYQLQLACSLKYFSDMGKSYDEHNDETRVYPHSGNYHFFNGETTAWYKSLFFINGVKNNIIMGSPLFLAFSTDSTLKI